MRLKRAQGVPGRSGFGHDAANPCGNLSAINMRAWRRREAKVELTVVLYLLVVLDRLSMVASVSQCFFRLKHYRSK